MKLGVQGSRGSFHSAFISFPNQRAHILLVTKNTAERNKQQKKS
jgi:hypothetical protein